MSKEIPKYILKAIESRANAAYLFNKYDLMISQWCDKQFGTYHNIEDTYGYVDTVSNPYIAMNRCKEQIKQEMSKNKNER